MQVDLLRDKVFQGRLVGLYAKGMKKGARITDSGTRGLIVCGHGLRAERAPHLAIDLQKQNSQAKH